MIIQGLLIAGVAKTFYSVNKSSNMDAKALEKYAKAFSISKEAEVLVQKKAEFTEKRLLNVAKKKRAIVEHTVPKFVEVYGKIQKIELGESSLKNDIMIKSNIKNLGVINSLSIVCKKEFTDKELLCGWIFKGIGGLMEMDSQQYLSAANSQVRAANVIYSQSRSIIEVYDAIVQRADRIAKLLVSMNVLFLGSISKTNDIINKNGLDVKKYSEYEKGVLMTCVNIACSISDIINVPVIDENGNISEAANEMIATGENYLEKMNKLINS
ncbi:hypothetical protein B5E58_11025 [Tyzzerella sp. An114]|uniref:hypothetical protein n=1 Tax=Tyzzerella sp. An114 TaxID=1965545 RepID=UPI000B453D7D|nr:hypothetical protein [Tyzzerella sp. An114]OUQ56199.1 hypothetical protein B5E58_11025 [Tyzzerella sp. An114]